VRHSAKELRELATVLEKAIKKAYPRGVPTTLVEETMMLLAARAALQQHPFNEDDYLRRCLAAIDDSRVLVSTEEP
jgi:hypothetical protein